MKDWRETGVVPDSEDEFDEEDLESLRDESTPTDINHDSTTPPVTRRNVAKNATRVEQLPAPHTTVTREDDSSIWDIPSSSAESNADASKKVWSSQTDGSVSRSSPADLQEVPLADGDEGDSKTELNGNVAIDETKNLEEEDEDDDMVELVMHPSDIEQATNEIPTLKSSPRRNSIEIPSSQDSEVIGEISAETPKKQTADPMSEDDEDDREKTPRPRDATPTPLPRQVSPLSSPLSPALSLDEIPSDFSIVPPQAQTPSRPPPFAVVLTKTPALHPSSSSPIRNSPSPQPPASTIAANNHDEGGDVLMQDTFTDGITGRLRHRQPIQLNPYLIEQERYRQTWKSRGLRPVRFLEPTPPAHAPKPAAHDSQEDEYSTSSQREDEEPPSSSIGVPEDIENVRDNGNNSDDDDGDSNLPSVEELFDQQQHQRRNSDPRISSLGTKRRRVDTTKKPLKHPHLVVPRSAKTAKALLNKTASIPNAMRLVNRPTSPDPFDLPFSPPENTSLNNEMVTGMADDSSSDDLPVSPQKRRQSPGKNRLSSTPRPTGVTVISSASEEESDDSSQERRVHAIDEQEKKELVHRMRGVLPASFLVINQKTLAKKNEKEQQHIHKQSGGMSRPGLARKITKGSRPERPLENLDRLIQSDDNSSEEEAPSSRPTTNLGASSPMPGTAPSRPIDLGDSFENNSIDMMVSRGPRNSSTQTKIKRTQSAPMHQSPLPFENENSRKRKSLGHSSSSRPKSKKTKHSTTSRPRRKQQLVSILDVGNSPTLGSGSSRISVPQFLNVAKRRARQKKDQGRCGPRGKFIKLEDDEDAAEVSRIMRSWKRGTLPVEKAPEPSRSSGVAPGASNSSSSSRGNNGHIVQRRLNMMLLQPRGSSSENVISSSKQHRKPERRPLAVVTPSANTVFQTHAPPLKQTQLETVTYTRPYVPPTHGRLENVFEYLLVNSAAKASKASSAHKQSRAPNAAHNSRSLIRQSDGTIQAISQSADRQNASHNIVRRRRKAAPTRNPRAAPSVYAVNNDVFRTITSAEVNYAVNDDVSGVVTKPSEPAQDYLTGLAPYGLTYTFDFGIEPFREGVHFQKESFIGSGDLDRALKTGPARISSITSSNSIAGNFFGRQLYWTQWDQVVGAQFESIMRTIGDRIEEVQNGQIADVTLNDSFVNDCLSFHRFHINYVSSNLSFSDPTGLVMFKDFLMAAVDDLRIRMDPDALASAPRGSEFAVRMLMFSLIHLVQLDFLLENDPSALSEKLHETASIILHRLVFILVKEGPSSLEECFKAQKRQTNLEHGISSDYSIIEAWATLHILSKNSKLIDDPLWPIINTSLNAREISTTKSVPALEYRWNVIFALLPITQFDSTGRATSFPAVIPNNWAIVKELVERVLKVYKAMSSTSSLQSQYNPYVRAVFGRCFYLISRWHWARPNPIIRTLLDFFKSRKLMNLAKEEDKGLSDFIEKLGQNLDLALDDKDLCIHILLKVIIEGIKFLTKTAPDSVVRDLAMLLYPLHGRQLLKEQEVEKEELSALKNHFGILTAIYCSVPPQHRRVDVFANLVIPEESHLGACKTSLKAWSNVVTFQLLQDCDMSRLTPLMEWFSNIMQKTLDLHQQAQAQANNQYQALLKAGEFTIDKAHFDHVVRKNRRRLEDILYYGIGLLQSAMKEMPKVASTMVAMMVESATTSIFNLVTSLPDYLIIGSLILVLQFVSLAQSLAQSNEQQSNEDSQNFDWSGFDDAMIETDLKPATDFLRDTIHDPLHRLLSNCFGADISKSEQVLETCIKTWVSLAGFLVSRNRMDWSDYVNQGRYSWLALRGTKKTKVYASKFMKQVVDQNYAAYEANKTELITFWLTTLVNHDSVLKYEHEFTSALFNTDQSNPLFQNPPFERKSDGRFDITRTEFIARRISLISTVLENIRAACEASALISAGRPDTSRIEYSGMLKSLMRAMKDGFLELQSFQGRGDKTGGTYVDFVHAIVELLQQYTADIVPVDSFFVDSVQFPLPATDPTYVVGRLKNYGLKLDTTGSRKQLASYFRATCDRAVVGGNREYLLSQLAAAYQPTYEVFNLEKPSLRFFTVLTMLPAYAYVSLASVAGRVLAEPIMETTERIMGDISVCVNSFEPASVEAVLTMIIATWDALRESVKEWMHHRQAIDLTAGMLQVLTVFYRILSASLPTFDWLCSTTHGQQDRLETLLKHGVDLAEYFIELSTNIEIRLQGEEWPEEPEVPTNATVTTNNHSNNYNSPFANERQSFKAELINILRKDWMLMGGDSLFVIRAGNRKIVQYEKYDTPQKKQTVHDGLPKAMHEFRMIAGREDILKEVVAKKYEVDLRVEMRRTLKFTMGIGGGGRGGYFDAHSRGGEWVVDVVGVHDAGGNDGNDDDDEVFDFSD